MDKPTYENDELKTITSDMVLFDISFYKDHDYLMNLEKFIGFVKACEKTIRKHPDYDNFVSTIREFNMDHCQVLGNISRFDATIEAHHGPLFTLFDYCVIVINSMMKRNEKITTFRVAKKVLEEHFNGNVQIVMLCKTVHQMIDTGEIFINLNQGIGDVNAFIKKYKDGLDETYIDKINAYIDLSKKFESTDNGILELEKNMVCWSYRKQPNAIDKL